MTDKKDKKPSSMQINFEDAASEILEELDMSDYSLFHLTEDADSLHSDEVSGAKEI